MNKIVKKEEYIMELSERINLKKKEIATDSYPMSIGELINLYRDEELDIHPQFQRLFRWNDYQKTKLIESIMLNIPLPSIFVSQNDEGVWDVVDGVQRLSTIFQFVGILKDESGGLVPPFRLQGTKYIPEFENKKWNSEGADGFSRDLQLDFKRTKLSINIVKKESDPSTKYELFQRLNTGGSQLSPQEVRNCLMIMTDSSFYDNINTMANDESFLNTTPISDRKSDEQFRLELVTRYLVGKYSNLNRLTKDYKDINNLLDDEILKIAESNKFDKEDEYKKFKELFVFIDEVLGENAFKRYKKENDKFGGACLTSSFQAITIGIGENFEYLKSIKKEDLIQKIKNMYSEEIFEEMLGKGVKSIDRFVKLSNFGKEYFSK